LKVVIAAWNAQARSGVFKAPAKAGMDAPKIKRCRQLISSNFKGS